MNDVAEQVGSLQRCAEEIVNTEPQSLANMEPGDEWRQGDLRIIRLPDDVDTSGFVSVRAKLQLVDGTTQGSRHCLDSLDGVEMFALKDAGPLDGPVIRTTAERAILHPEHGDCVDMPPGWYAFPGQRTYADELRRVAD
jgi:hypothetical protein